MAFDPRWQPPPLQIQPPINPSHRPSLHYNLPIQNPRSEATATIPAVVAVARQNFYYSQGASIANPEQFPVPEAAVAGTHQQQYYYYQQGAAASNFSSSGLPSAGQYCYREEPVPEIPSIASIPVAPPLIIPQERNNTRKGKSKKRMKKAKVVQPLHCAVCKIFCDTQEVLDRHKQGKQHKKNLQKLKDAITPKPKEIQSTLNESENKEHEKMDLEKNEPEKIELEQIPEGWNKAQPIHCKICDIYCNTVEFLKLHEAGKKHFKNVAKLKTAAETNTEKDKETKAYVVAQPQYCQICSILCSSQEDFEIHCKGKNHRKKAQIQDFYNLKPEGIQMVMPNNENSNQMKRKAAEINSTKKKRKVIGCEGMSIESKIRCDICNIEVNSQTVYASHLAGSKHAAKVKLLHRLQVGNDFQQPVTAVADDKKIQN